MENNLELENKINNNLENKIENEQNNFLNTNIGKIANTAIDVGLRFVLPDIIENQVIEVKNALIDGGIKQAFSTAIEEGINFGKSALGIVTGNFENIQQMQTAVKSGGIIDGISNVLNFTINKVVNSGKIPYALGSAIKTGKNAILNNITKNIESEFENQVNQIEKLNKYTNNWKDYFNNKDFDGMQREYDKIRGKMKEIAPIENTIKTARVIENLHKLIKNNGKNFDLTSEELELAKML